MSLKRNKFIKNAIEAFKNLPGVIFRLFFPDSDECYLCRGVGNVVCEKCSYEIERHEGVLCDKCGRSIKSAGFCVQCAKNVRPYEKGEIALFYQDKALKAMKDFKFENKLPYAEFFAEEIYKKVVKHEKDIDCIAAVPSHFLKAIGKGYNPPSLIARKLAHMMGKDFDGQMLARIRYTKSMSLLKGIDRMAHVKKNFKANAKKVSGKSILLIDDVSTTGATLHICTQLLIKAGAKKVYVAAACGDKSQIVYR